MTSTLTEAKTDTVSGPAREHFDCVYFLMFAGWETEFRSNRWNFATRWARHLPVVLVQPTLSEEQPLEIEEPETRIPNTSILRVRSCPTDVTPTEMHLADSVMVAVQIRRHMERRGFKKPLLWLYNPWLVHVFQWLPAVFRFMHATEDWPRFPMPDSDYTRLFKKLAAHGVSASELVVAVSSGVAEGIQSLTTPDRLMTVTNGCDFSFYASPQQPDAEVLAAAAGYDRTGIFAGNIGSYFNLPLMTKAARNNPNTFFCLFGRETFTEESQEDLRELRACQNVRFFGEVPPERIPGLYASVHFGLIPYVDLENLKKSGFALKLLEMAAAGLPVVSTDMIPMRGLASRIHVTADEADFLEYAARIDKRTLSTEESDELLSVARANDYDLKFAQILDGLLHRIQSRPTGAISAEILTLCEDQWLADALQRPGACSVIDLAEAYLAQHGVDKPDAMRVAYFAMQNGIAQPHTGKADSPLVAMLRNFRADAARATSEAERADRAAKRVEKLATELAKAKDRIAKLKARDEKVKKKTLKMRLKRLLQSILGHSSSTVGDENPV